MYEITNELLLAGFIFLVLVAIVGVSALVFVAWLIEELIGFFKKPDKKEKKE